MSETIIGRTYRGDWQEAPKWANWKAQDADGTWKWFSTKPKPHNFGLYVKGTFLATGKGKEEIIGSENATHYLTTPNPSWRKTIEKRTPQSKDNTNVGGEK